MYKFVPVTQLKCMAMRFFPHRIGGLCPLWLRLWGCDWWRHDLWL